MWNINQELPENVRWQGFETTWTKLREAGWEVSRKQGYQNWRYPDNNANDKMYIRNKETHMIGRLTLNGQTNEPLDSRSYTDSYCTLDFLTHEKNIRFFGKAIYETRELEEADIGPLLELVLKLQQKFKREPKKQKPTNVIELPVRQIA